MANSQLALALKQLKRVPLGTLPTPLHRLINTQNKLGLGELYIKRDDLTGLGPGGNKTRSLEYILGDALHSGADTILASGPLQSNLCTLTAAACAKLGLSCELIHNGEQPENPQGNLLLNSLLGAHSHYIGEADAQQRGIYVEKLAESLRQSGSAPYIIQNGATTGHGAMGYVNAVLELSEQCAAQGANIKTLFAPGGNGGVAAGLIYGNALLGLPFQIVIISVEDETEVMARHIADTIAQAEQILGLPFGHSLGECCTLADAYRGGGWGQNTPESARIVEDFPRTEGIFIENVYNSKVLVGMLDMLRKGEVQGGACYLHTGGFGSLFSQFYSNSSK